jgi:hypothetical protein
VEEMKYYTFKRKTNNFSDILKDPGVKKYISTRISWPENLMIGLKYDTPDSVLAYIVLKYGDDIHDPIHKDFSPIPGKDYMPKKEPKVTVLAPTQADNGA